MTNSTSLAVTTDVQAELIDCVSVRYDGTVLLFARLPGAVSAIYYNARLPTVTAGARQQFIGWKRLDLAQAAPAGDLPQLVRVAGMSLITAPPLVTVPSPADAPFRVVSDEKYIYVFRVSTHGTLYLNRFLVMPVSGPDPDADRGKSPPIEYELEPIWESRYERSGLRDTPAGPKDTLGVRDMTGHPFIEPTLELVNVTGVTAGNFAVFLAPSAVDGTNRWHFVVADTRAQIVRLQSYPQLASGLLQLDPGKAVTSTIAPLLAVGGSATGSLTLLGGVDATLYGEQEPADSSDPAQGTLRRAARVMLALPVSAAAQGMGAAIAVYDFGLAPDGTLPALPARTASVVLDGTLQGGTYAPATAPFPVTGGAVTIVETTTIYAYVLGQTQAVAPPQLLDGGDGLVHLYFAGTPKNGRNPFLVAQYAPAATRAAVSVGWTAGLMAGTVEFVALRSGTSMSGLSVTIAASMAGGTEQPDLCDVTVDYGADAPFRAESFRGVPRELNQFLAVVNGTASVEPQDPNVLNGSVTFFDYTGSRPTARIPLGNVGAPTGFLPLVSARTDVVLSQVQVAVSGSTATATITFVAGSTTITQTWSALPVAAAHAAVVLGGMVSGSVYAYSPGASDTAVVALVASGGSMLLFVKSGVTAASVSIAVVAAKSGNALQLDVTVGSVATLYDVPSDQATFASTLMASSAVASIFSAISVGAPAGVVGVQTVQGPIHGDGKRGALSALSTLFHVLPATGEDALAASTVRALTLQAHVPPNPALPNAMVAATASSASFPANGAPALVGNQTSTTSATPSNGKWVAERVLSSLRMSQGGAMSVSTTTPQFSLLSPRREWTLEAWVQPVDGMPARIFSFDAQASKNGLVPSYMLGTIGQKCLSYQPVAPSPAGLCSYVLVNPPPTVPLPPSAAFTWEVWVKPRSPVAPTGKNGSIIQLYDPNDPSDCPLEIALDQSLTPVVGTFDGRTKHTFVAAAPIPATTWTHLAVTGSLDPVTKVWQLELFVNDTDPQPFTATMPLSNGLLLYIGGSGQVNNPSLDGDLAEVRVWSTARALADIESSMFIALTGNEPGLVGYWQLGEDPTNGAAMINSCAATKKSGLDGIVTNLTKVQPVVSSPDSSFLSVVAAVGGGPARVAQSFLWASAWNHVAVTYEAGTALTFDPSKPDFVNCGNGADFDVSSTCTIEAWVKIPKFNHLPNALVSKWGPTPATQSFLLGVDARGALMAAVQLDVPGLTLTPLGATATKGPSIVDGQAHHVAVVYSTTTSTGGGSNGTATVTGLLALYVDGQPAGGGSTLPLTAYGAAPIQLTKTSVALGAAALDAGQVALESNAYYAGTLTGVRIWDKALTGPEVQQSMQQAQAFAADGALAAWWFTEQSGTVAADGVANNNGTLSRDDMWTLFSELSQLNFFANGKALATGGEAPASTTTGYPKGDTQFTVGGYFAGGNLVDGFGGQLDELRIWEKARSLDELNGDRFRPLMGDEHGLVAYWNFNARSLADQTGHGNLGTFAGPTPPVLIDSTAPVSSEGPYVRNVYGGMVTTYQRSLDGRPGVIEYGDVARDRAGSPTGVLARGYYFRSGSMQMPPGFTVGTLRLTYLGQVQTNPTLVGYIEGAPPVPSENLSRPFYVSTAAPFFNYFGASSVTLTEAEATTFTFTTNDSVGTVMYDIAASVGYAGAFKTGASTLIWNELASAEYALTARYKGSEIVGSAAAESRASSWTKTLSDTLALRGDWEPEQKDVSGYLNPVVGRRFLPANTGYALVVSQTADLYVSQLDTTGAMVGRFTIPNLEIPPDTNIITFQISDKYVKNGTLDGKVGLVNDTSYSNADYERGSYFQPLEAYRLKARIERENLELTALYDQFNVRRKASLSNADVSYGESLFADLESKLFVNRTGSASVRKSLCNTYVWSAAGGLHAEEEQFSDTRQVTYSGFRKAVQTAGASISAKVLGGLPLSQGVVASYDFLSGQQVDFTVGKAQTNDTKFGLSVAVPGDPILLGWKGSAYTPGPCPGKVNSYRFNAFYLAPSIENASKFHEIVDEVWKHSDDPNAVALRQARISGNSVWRVLYRVTYVNRVPPEYDNDPDQTVAPEYVRTIDVNDNAALLSLLETALGASPPTPENVGAAIATVMAPPPAGDVYPKSILGASLSWWEGFLATTRHGASYNAAAATWLTALLYDTLTYVLTGFSTRVLGDGDASHAAANPTVMKMLRAPRRGAA